MKCITEPNKDIKPNAIRLLHTISYEESGSMKNVTHLWVLYHSPYNPIIVMYGEVIFPYKIIWEYDVS